MSAPVLLSQPNTDEWLTLRQQGIGASEIAAVMGISPWESPFSLWHRKANGWGIDADDVMRAGHYVEPAAADWWASECDPHENLVVSHGGLYAHAQRPWQLATPDRLVGVACPSCVDGPPEHFGCWDCRNTGQDGPPMAVLECKWVAHSWDGWGDPGTDDIPVHYRAQVLWQCDVMDVDTWYLAALGPGGFRQYEGKRDETDLATMRAAGQEFMDSLAAGTPPPLDSHTATLTTLKRLHPDLDDTEVEVEQTLADRYMSAVALLRIAEAERDATEILLRAAMSSARRATHDGRTVATRVISEIAESTRVVKAHRRDYLLAPRGKK